MRFRNVVVAASLLAAGVWGTAVAVAPTIVHVPPAVIDTLDGADLYAAYCTSCHGESGRGDGAVATLMAVPVPDLTRIANRSGAFDYWAVRRDIAGLDRAAGSVMPIWSPTLASTYSSSAREELILHNLVLHLESIQARAENPVAMVSAHPRIVQKPIPDVSRSSGAEIYASLCADCHGATGRGDGRIAVHLDTQVPDLTRLAQQGGQFDSRQVRESISHRQMVPLAEAEAWWPVFAASFGQSRANMMVIRLAQHLEEMQNAR